MDASVVVALAASLSSLAVAVGTLFWNSRENGKTRTLQKGLAEAQRDLDVRLSEAQRAAERDLREEERRSEAKKVLDRYRGPLMDAAWQLGNRIDNIRHRNFLRFLAEGSGREQDAKLTTLFRFALYFGWREFVRGEVQLLRFENEKDTRIVAGFVNDVARILASGSLDEGQAMLWADEQRGIGELMASDRPGGSAVRGHAAFHGEYDEVFGPWMERFANDLLSSAMVGSDRLRLLQWALFGLVRRLDEEGSYGPSDWLERAEQEFREAPSDGTISKPESQLRERLALVHAATA